MIMKILDRNQPTEVAFTLYEKCSNEIDKNFFFVLKNKETKEEFFVTQSDISTAPNIYNLFVFTNYETESCGEFTRGLQGYYTAGLGEYIYTVYQSNQPEYFDLNEAIQVESGILKIVSERVKYETIDDGDNYHIPVLNVEDIMVINKNNC